MALNNNIKQQSDTEPIAQTQSIVRNRNCLFFSPLQSELEFQFLFHCCVPVQFNIYQVLAISISKINLKKLILSQKFFFTDKFF